MKRILFLVACVLFWGIIIAGPTFAAENPVAGVQDKPDTADWRGFYAGLNAGYSWYRADSKTYSTVTGNLLGEKLSKASGDVYGGRIGYDHVFAGNWLLGVATEVSYGDIKVEKTISNAAGTNIHKTVGENDWNGSIFARAGFATGRWLIYGIGGWTWSNSESKRTQLVGTMGNATAGTVEKEDFTMDGWTLGGGFEILLTNHLSLYSEYRYTDYRTDKITFSLTQQTSDADATTSSLQCGINYKF